MTTPSQFGLIVLAAGLSRRMGGPNKLLEPYGDAPLLAHALRTASKAGMSDRVVVTGRDCQAIQDLAGIFGYRSVHNPGYREGLGTSLAIGAAALREDVTGLFVALGDMPDIGLDDYTALASSFAPGAIVIPVNGGSRGHPVLFCRSYRGELALLSGDEGARPVIKRNAGAVIQVETGNAGILRDLDLPEDFRNAASREP